MLSRTASGNASSGADGFEFEVITCVVLGVILALAVGFDCMQNKKRAN